MLNLIKFHLKVLEKKSKKRQPVERSVGVAYGFD